MLKMRSIVGLLAGLFVLVSWPAHSDHQWPPPPGWQLDCTGTIEYTFYYGNGTVAKTVLKDVYAHIANGISFSTTQAQAITKCSNNFNNVAASYVYQQFASHPEYLEAGWEIAGDVTKYHCTPPPGGIGSPNCVASIPGGFGHVPFLTGNFISNPWYGGGGGTEQ